MSRIDLLKQELPADLRPALGPQRRRAAAGLARRLRQGRRAEAAAAAGAVRGGDPADRPPLARHRPDRRLRRLAVQPGQRRLTPRATSSRRNCSTTAALADFKQAVVARIGRGAAVARPIPRTRCVALYGVASLFGFLRISEILPLVEGHIRGRLLVFFPGVYEQNNYRLLDARDGWNYHAVPITASEGEVRR